MEAVWGGVGIVALLLGGFGVFAVAVISVRARRREIGIRIAAGAAGVLFSAFPALRAARLDPVAALATAA